MTVTETSKESYEQVKLNLNEKYTEILEAMEDYQRIGEDITDRELTKYLEKDHPNEVRPRRNELVNIHKLIGFSQKRICKISGKRVLAWKLLRRITREGTR